MKRPARDLPRLTGQVNTQAYFFATCGHGLFRKRQVGFRTGRFGHQLVIIGPIFRYRLVLVVGGHQDNRLAEHLAAEIVDSRSPRLRDTAALDRDGDAVVSGIGAPIEPVAVDADAVNGGEAEGIGTADHLVTVGLELARDAMQDPVRHVDRVAGCRKARGAHRFGHRHVEIDDVQDRLEHSHRDLRRSGCSDHQIWPAVAEDD